MCHYGIHVSNAITATCVTLTRSRHCLAAKCGIHAIVWAILILLLYNLHGALHIDKAVHSDYRTSWTDVTCECYGLPSHFVPQVVDLKYFDGMPSARLSPAEPPQIHWSHTSCPTGGGAGGYSHWLHIAIEQLECSRMFTTSWHQLWCSSNKIVVVTSFIFDTLHLLTEMRKVTGSTIYIGISKNGRMARGLWI